VLTSYPDKPNSIDVFLRFCDNYGVDYFPEMKETESQKAKTGGTDEKKGASGRQLINLKSVIKDLNTVTSEIVNICTSSERSYINASEQISTLQTGFQTLVEKKPELDRYLADCLRFSENLTLSVSDNSESDDVKKTEGFLGKISDKFAKITQPIGKSVDRRIAVIESEPFKYLPDMRDGIQSLENIKVSLQNLLNSFDNLFDGRSSIFEESDKNLAMADIDLGYLRRVSVNATQLCENANAQNEVSNLIDIDAERTLVDLQKLYKEAQQHSNDVNSNIGTVVTVYEKYITVLNSIRQGVEQIGKKNAEAYDYSSASINNQVDKFKIYNLIGYGAFVFSLLFSIPNIIRILLSLFTLNLTWQNGKGMFGFMLVFILIVPVVFMFVRSYWIKFLHQTISTINRISLGFESKIEDYEQFQSNIYKMKSLFVTSSKIFDLLVVINFMLCSVSFIVYVLMAAIAAIIY
jgi:hypothetical protein